MATTYKIIASATSFNIQEIEGEDVVTDIVYPKGSCLMSIDNTTVVIKGQYSKNIIPIAKIAEPTFETVDELQAALMSIIN